MYYFKANQLSVGYQKVPVLKEVDFALKKGEIMTLIGPNGAGKSTVLKSIARQLSLISGTVVLEQSDMDDLSGKELAKKMSVVLTKKLQAELMTCEDVVETGRYPYTGKFGVLTKKDRALVEEAMELVHVSELADCDFTKISDGQRQRVMLARAICQQPDIIILDEPTSFLDVRYKLEFLHVLQELKREKNLTVIMSMHELDLAQRISDKILCLNENGVDYFGTPDEVFKAGYIAKLFSVTDGFYDETLGVSELMAPKGEAKVFVIGGNKSAGNIYRKLQRSNVPFYTGIISDNDIDYPVAKALSAEVVETPAFEPVMPELLKQAQRLIDRCERVIASKEVYKVFEAYNQELRDYASSIKKEILSADDFMKEDHEVWQK